MPRRPPKTDPELQAHKEWLGYLQPRGLVVAPAARRAHPAGLDPRSPGAGRVPGPHRLGALLRVAGVEDHRAHKGPDQVSGENRAPFSSFRVVTHRLQPVGLVDFWPLSG
ncbi:hypothetical protein NZK33_20860 [Cyanobium sp. FGCU-6]|nr:hypothetical protein [Cyanobium sp. FGCU6]